MDLVFRQEEAIIKEDRFKDVTPQKRKEFGNSSKYRINLIFKKNSDWEEEFPVKFKFDTGAFLSFAPKKLMEDFSIPTEFSMEVTGIHPEKKCRVLVKIGKMLFKILDDNELESDEFEAWFAFHPFEKGMHLLGMKSIIEEIEFHQDPKRKILILKTVQ